MNQSEHNPDGLSEAQYGAPEWRLLKVGENVGKGDEGYWGKDTGWKVVCGLVNTPVISDGISFRRRVSVPTEPAPSDKEAKIERFRRQGAPLLCEPQLSPAGHFMVEKQAEIETLRSKLATVERERDSWRRTLEVMTTERDAALAEVEQQKKDHPRTPYEDERAEIKAKALAAAAVKPCADAPTGEPADVATVEPSDPMGYKDSV